jgi:hypothetical protein
VCLFWILSNKLDLNQETRFTIVKCLWNGCLDAGLANEKQNLKIYETGLGQFFTSQTSTWLVLRTCLFYLPIGWVAIGAYSKCLICMVRCSLTDVMLADTVFRPPHILTDRYISIYVGTCWPTVPFRLTTPCWSIPAIIIMRIDRHTYIDQLMSVYICTCGPISTVGQSPPVKMAVDLIEGYRGQH